MLALFFVMVQPVNDAGGASERIGREDRQADVEPPATMNVRITTVPVLRARVGS